MPLSPPGRAAHWNGGVPVPVGYPDTECIFREVKSGAPVEHIPKPGALRKQHPGGERSAGNAAPPAPPIRLAELGHLGPAALSPHLSDS